MANGRAVPGPEGDGPGQSRVRLAMTQPPIHWSAENLAFAYLATSLAMGMEAALACPST